MDQDSISPSAIPRPADRTTADDIGGIDPPRSAAGQVRIRPVVPGDTDGLRALHTAASNQSLYLRFFGYSRTAVEEYLTVLSRPASRTHQAQTARVGSRLVGIAAFERLTGDTAEVALLVADDHHERNRHPAHGAPRAGGAQQRYPSLPGRRARRERPRAAHGACSAGRRR